MSHTRTTDIPFVPDVINTSLLKDGRLVSAATMAQIEQKLASGELKPGRISKKKLAEVGIYCNASIIALDKKQIFAIFPGKKQDMLVGEGTYGRVKVAQDRNGKFVVLKLQNQTSDAKKAEQTKEFQMLEKTGQAIGSVEYQSQSKGVNTFAVLMEFAQGVEGHKLPAMKPIQYVGMLREAVRALRELHGSGVLHLDTKPENMMIDPVSGRCK